VNYRFRSAKSFRRARARLNPKQKQAAKAVFRIFKQNPFDPRLRAHKIHNLSAAHGKNHLLGMDRGRSSRRFLFLEGSTVWSIDIGTHAIYRS